MKLMRQGFSWIVQPDVEFEPDDIVDQRAAAIFHGIIEADEQGDFHNRGGESPVHKAPRYAVRRQEEFDKPLEERLSRASWITDRGC
jgi:hypothetical protein